MKTASAKAKGRRCAREVQEIILKLFLSDLEEDDVIITPSGVTGEDLRFSPKARKCLPFSTECKNIEKLPIWSALRQAEDNAKGHTPVLFFRRNRSKLYAAIEAEELIKLYREVHSARNNKKEG